LIFKSEDFLGFNDKVEPGSSDSLEEIARIANEKFMEWLYAAPFIYSDHVNNVLWIKKFGSNACRYRARLVCIEEYK